MKPLSLHSRILDEIQGRILSGEWAPGHRIPFEIDLAAQYGCSRMTVNKVMTELVQRGLIERRRKSGSYVAQPHSASAVLEISDVKAEVEQLGSPYRYERLSFELRKPNAHEKKLLELTDEDEIIHLLACHYAGPAPFCIERRVINLTAVPDAAQETFAHTAPGPWLVASVPWSAAQHRIRATTADLRTAKLLAIGSTAACLVIERRTWSAERYITHVELTYPGNRHELIAEFAPAGPRT